MSFENQEGSLFIINGKKYIYVGLQEDKNKNQVPTFYGLDALDNGEEVNLTGSSVTNFENKSNTTPADAADAVLQMVRSPIYSQYKAGVPPKLRRAPGLPGPAAFYQIPGTDATPERLNKTSDIESAKQSNFSFVYRVGSNGPSIQYIKEGKIKDIKNFIKDYKKMTLTKSMQPSSPVVEANTALEEQAISAEKAILEEPTIAVGEDDSEGYEGLKATKLTPSQENSVYTVEGKPVSRRGGRTKRQRKQKNSRSYRNKR